MQGRRIGIILIAMLALVSGAFQRTAKAQNPDDCTTCPSNAKTDCYQCHSFTYYTVQNGCMSCGGGELAAKSHDRQLPLQERLKRGQIVYVLGKVTGSRMPMERGWASIKMPTTHDIDEVIARKSMTSCKVPTKKQITE